MAGAGAARRRRGAPAGRRRHRPRRPRGHHTAQRLAGRGRAARGARHGGGGGGPPPRPPAARGGAGGPGGAVAPLHPALSPDERARTLADLRPRLTLDTVGEGQGEMEEWARPVDPGSAALILYTSGSTGRSKGAVLSHAALDAALESWAGPVMALTPADGVLATVSPTCPLPPSCGTTAPPLPPLLGGTRVAIVDPFPPPAVLAAIARHRVTV